MKLPRAPVLSLSLSQYIYIYIESTIHVMMYKICICIYIYVYILMNIYYIYIYYTCVCVCPLVYWVNIWANPATSASLCLKKDKAKPFVRMPYVSWSKSRLTMLYREWLFRCQEASFMSMGNIVSHSQCCTQSIVRFSKIFPSQKSENEPTQIKGLDDHG